MKTTKSSDFIEITTKKNWFPTLISAVGVILMLTLWIGRLNILAIVCAGYCCIVALIMFLSLAFSGKLNFQYFLGYTSSLLGITIYYIIFGVDMSFGGRLLSNILLALPSFAALTGLYYVTLYFLKNKQRLLAVGVNLVLILTSIVYVLTMNLKSMPKAFDLSSGEADYLNNIDKNANADSPNVLFILMDDLGYGDLSCYGSLYDTPNIDSIADNGLVFENFYASYSVCSPSRFAALTGRYPYRGYADNVMYPTEKCYVPFSTTRLFNSIELGGNVDGMLGDEVTVAETLGAAGYNTALIGKWHLGDYGQYLPTNQGFDYFYGSYQVNDMTPYYICETVDGVTDTKYTTAELRADQSIVSSVYNEAANNWLTDTVNGSDQPFFMYYSTPWPHAPISVGKDFDGYTGMGAYADAVVEFDYYLGQLFDTMKELGVYDNTIIVFTSDNGPALQGSTNELRGGKYLAYEGGQKVPYLMKLPAGLVDVDATANRAETLNLSYYSGEYKNDGLGTNVAINTNVVSAPATLIDLYPTLSSLCDITEKSSGKVGYLPSDVDREIDGVSMIPLLTGEKQYIHDVNHPILHMKREVIKAVQYAIDSEDVVAKTSELNNGDYNYADYRVLNENSYLQFKYFRRIQNDNSAFFDKYRKHWLHILTDDTGENYNRANVYPEIANEMDDTLQSWTDKFAANRRGYFESYYKK